MSGSSSAKSEVSFEHRMVEAAIDSAVNAIIIIDSAGIIRRANPATEVMFGFSLEELIGNNVDLLMAEPHHDAHDRYLQNYLETGEKKIIGIGREVHGRHKDGSVFPIHLSVGEFEANGARYFVGTIHDISARAAAQRETARQRALFEAIYNNCPDAMIISGDKERITLCNPAAHRIFGYALGKLESLTCRDLFASDEDYSRFAEIASAGMAHDHSRSEIINFIRAEGETFPGVTGMAGIVGADGQQMGFLCIIRDVTRELAQDQALRHGQRMEALGQLTGGIAHDFNNLLTIITGNLELLEMDLEAEEQRDLLRRANDAAVMGARLTDRLLTFARRRPLDAVLMNLNEQVLGMMDLLRRSLGETISLASSFAPDLWPVRSDVSEIENAVLNLAINARDAMPDGGRLLIETRNVTLSEPQQAEEVGLPAGDYVRLSVSDTGHGIPADQVSRVFEPFFTTKEGGRGTGLGLSVIYGFARQSGGQITIYSELARGTTVNLYLPRTETKDARRTEQARRVQPRAAGNETVLVVEDQAPVREITVQRLQRLGYRTLEAENAPAAIALLEAGQTIDLVFSDVVMPGGMTGFDLADWLKTHRPTTPIILTSGFAENIAQGPSQERAAVAILRKPYSGDDLAAQVREALDAKNLSCGRSPE